MPQGIDVLIEDGLATIDFVDRSLKGPGLARLLEVAPADQIEKLTRSGPRPVYRVPEGFARAAELLDDPAPTDDDADADEPAPVTESESAVIGFVEADGPTPEPAEVVGADTPDAAPVLETPAPASTQGYDDGEPDMDWSRKAIDAYAANKLTPPLNTSGEDNKRDALTAIRNHIADHPQP